MKMHIALLACLLLLSACTPSQEAIEQAIAQTQTAAPTQTLAPTQTPEPTQTPIPTDTLIPSATPVPEIDPVTLTGSVIAAFKNAGLEAENPARAVAQDYGAAPFVCYGVHFFIPSLGEGKGGRVFACKDPGEQAALSGYYETLSKSNALFFSWVFVKGNIIVQINGELPEVTARQYESAIP